MCLCGSVRRVVVERRRGCTAAKSTIPGFALLPLKSATPLLCICVSVRCSASAGCVLCVALSCTGLCRWCYGGIRAGLRCARCAAMGSCVQGHHRRERGPASRNAVELTRTQVQPTRFWFSRCLLLVMQHCPEHRRLHTSTSKDYYCCKSFSGH